MKIKKSWRVATILIATLLMFSLYPEIRIIGVFIDAIGLDALFFLAEAQILIILTVLYHQNIRPLGMWVNSMVEKLDKNYFLPSLAQIKEYPLILQHSVPFLVCSCSLMTGWLIFYS